VVGNNPSEVLLKALADVYSTLFDLFCFTKQNVSHLRSVFLSFFFFFKKSLICLEKTKSGCSLQYILSGDPDMVPVSL